LLSVAPASARLDPAWSTQVAPFQIADNLYYVGSRDLAAYLVTTPAGNILINANLATSPPQIRASVEKLGFHWADTKVLLNGQAHFDHVAGAAEVIRETHAHNMVMDGDAEVVRSGGRKDFAFGMDGIKTYTPAPVDRVLHDGDNVTLGGVTLTAHKTAGHTRGSTTWTFRTHIDRDPPQQLRDVVIVGGIYPLSQYVLVNTPGRKASYPGIENDFRQTFVKLRALPCDIFLGSHGIYFGLLSKLSRMPAEGESVFIDPEGYLETVRDAQAVFEEVVAKQSGSKHGSS
jgi:metallo-beta-lactamase class B